ncbi:hypothetical protein GCM10027046_00430 [Uliginosibacterium flavum]
MFGWPGRERLFQLQQLVQLLVVKFEQLFLKLFLVEQFVVEFLQLQQLLILVEQLQQLVFRR